MQMKDLMNPRKKVGWDIETVKELELTMRMVPNLFRSEMLIILQDFGVDRTRWYKHDLKSRKKLN